MYSRVVVFNEETIHAKPHSAGDVCGGVILCAALLILMPVLAQETTPEPPTPPTLEPTLTATPTHTWTETAAPTLSATPSQPEIYTATTSPTVTLSPSLTATPPTNTPTIEAVIPTVLAESLTPSPEPQSWIYSQFDLMNMQQQTVTTPGVDYIVINNAGDLVSAINEVCATSSSVPSPFRIFLRPATYTITATIQICSGKHIKIYGLGASVTIINDLIPNQVLFNNFGTLELHDLTINSMYKTHNYAGVILGGINRIDRSVIQNARTVSGGGAIHLSGTGNELTINNSIFRDNSSGGGGAIQMSAGTTNITCTRFEDNSANYAGAILNAAASRNVVARYSTFNNNTITYIGPYGGAIYNLVSGYSVDARENVWPSFGAAPTSGTDSVNFSVNTSLPISVPNFQDTLCPRALRLELTEAVPDSEPLQYQPAQELEWYYGIRIARANDTSTNGIDGNVENWTVLQGWSVTEANNILAGVRNTAIALGIQSDRAPLDAFYQVMKRETSNLDTLTDQLPFLAIIKSGAGACLTAFRNSPAATNLTTITCGSLTNFGQIEHVIVHELGHVFYNRTDPGNRPGAANALDLYEEVERTAETQNGVNTYPITLNHPTYGSLIIMGWIYNESTNESSWQRGESGWGTGPASTYNASGQPVTPNYTLFQQNPPPYDPSSGVRPYEETAADMFLNWVYRLVDSTASITGFRNITWAYALRDSNGSTCNTLPQGCPLAGSGDARNSWMQIVMNRLFTYQGWK